MTIHPAFSEVFYYPSTRRYLELPNAVHHTYNNGVILPSAQEMCAFRISSRGINGDFEPLLTRTAAVYFKSENKHYIAFDDSIISEENLIISKAFTGYAAFAKNSRFLLPIKDDLVAKLLARAEKFGRIVSVTHNSSPELSTKKEGTTSQFGSNPIVKAALGCIAEPYASYLQKQNPPQDGEMMYVFGIPNDERAKSRFAAIYYVGLGFDGCPSIRHIDAVSYFNVPGHVIPVSNPREFQ